MAEDLKIGDVETDVLTWLERVVIGLNLCPFARKPYEDERIRIVTELANDYDSILERLLAELSYLQDDNQQKVETTLVVVPNTLEDFNEYLACLADVNQLLISQGYEGALQVASFHPNYQFAGTRASDQSNLTNRAPFPVFHLIREDSLERALDGFEHAELIPERNIKLMNSMPEEGVADLFPWLFR